MKSLNLYDRLSNRTIALLLLILIGTGAYFGIRYIFFLNIGTISFEIVGEESYTVRLKKSEVVISQLECTKKCSFIEIPAGSYTYEATSPNRLPVTGSVEVRRQETSFASLRSKIDVQIGEAEKETANEIETANGTGATDRFRVKLNPLRLMKGETVLMNSSTAIGYSTDSLPFGYFLAFESNRTIGIYEISSGRTYGVNWDSSEYPTLTKRLANGKSIIILTRHKLFLFDPATSEMEENEAYDDIEASPNGGVLALVRSDSKTKKDFLGISDTPGDVLLDISKAGAPIILRTDISDTSAIYWDSVFKIRKRDGSIIPLNIR